jgi:hypothetical protein
VEILLWLVPPVVVTFLAMGWVGWLGRAGRGEVDHEEAVRRLGEALERPREPRAARTPRPRERSTGVALRRTRTVVGEPDAAPSGERPGEQPDQQPDRQPDRQPHRDRRAS